jgi:hypothetical protein
VLLALEQLAGRLGVNRDVLIGQALGMFLRLNGVEPNGASARAPAPPPPAHAPPARPGRPPPQPEPEPEPEPEPDQQPMLYISSGDVTLMIEGDRFLIGRGKHCQLVIDSAKVSREHAAITIEDGGWVLEDLGSSNGTFIGQKRVQRVAIDGDMELRLGTEVVRFFFQ